MPPLPRRSAAASPTRSRRAPCSWRARMLPISRGQVLHPNGGGIVGSQIGVPGLGSILRRPALSAVVLGLPFLLFVPEAAHAGNADRSPFRAHRCSPVVRQYLMDKRCTRRSGSDGWYSSNTDECLLRERSFPTSERRISPLWDFFSGTACVMLSLPEQDPTCRSFPLLPGAAPPRLGNPPRPYRARSAMPPRSTPAACCLWTIGFMLICSTRPCANRGSWHDCGPRP